MRTLPTLLACVLVAGCATTSPRDVSLAGRDLGKSQVVAELTRGLSPEERAAFLTYTFVHWPGAKGFCGRPMFSGKPPSTVGEAIAETQRFERDLEQKRLDETRPASAFEQRAMEERLLVDAFDQLTLERDMIADGGPLDAKQRKALEAIDRKLEANRAARRALAAPPPTS